MLRGAIGLVATLAVVVSAVGVGAPAQAAPKTRFSAVGLVSDQAGHAPLVDPALVNPWGLALSPTGPLWVSNNGTNTATLYAGGVNGATPTKAALVVTIPGGAPTGQVFNDTAAFVLPAGIGTGKAVFIFCSEDGDIVAWNGGLGTTAKVVAHVDGANYKGLAILNVGTTAVLLAANFADGRIDVFDATFTYRPAFSRSFTDKHLPKGFSPFNVFVPTGGRGAYVAYAKRDPATNDEIAGRGLGFVDFFDGFRNHPKRIASRGTLNAPWGMTIAPASFGRFAGSLLVGNFGDGRIGGYRHDDFIGLLRDKKGKAIAIEGLWALQPGTANTGGTNVVWFSAGPDEEQHGLVGQISPA
jgi:uncharacterized protein (TIGR03118 family)